MDVGATHASAALTDLNGSILGEVDARGIVIDEYGPNYGDLDLPIIDGLASPPRDGSSALDETRALLAARLIGDLSYMAFAFRARAI